MNEVTASRKTADAVENFRYKCRFCASELRHSVVDLGTAPLCQRHITPQKFDHAELIYPLHVYVCGECFLMQLPAYVASREVFDDEYGYFSSYSETWLRHAESYVAMMIAQFDLTSQSKVIELASNDGYLLQYFVRAGIPVLGVEPTVNTASAARQKGVRTITEFFGRQLAQSLLKKNETANVIVGNNVLAHVPDINDFVGGVKILLAPGGVVTMEFPQLIHLMERNYWDTIYHEHFSYLSLTTVQNIFSSHGLKLFDVDELPTHGGSIRIYGCHIDDPGRSIHARVTLMKSREAAAGHFDLDYYKEFGERVKESKRALLDLMIKIKRNGKRVAAYGAPGKGNTLLNYCGLGTDFIDYTVDRSPHKQGNYLPGTRIPIYAPEKVAETKPDYLLILPWNLKDEIMQQMLYIRTWGGRFITAIPIPEIL